METPIPNPFNGAEMFNGQAHHRAPGPFDDEDFGPETDVDMVDDVLLSPAIAAAKALVQGNDDDYERQRQQTKEFDDPVDLGRDRNTPTPLAHEVARELAESGGEDSEEEWNYIPGSNSGSGDQHNQEEEDMNSQLNPNAAEFVPVSPKRLMDESTIASSPARGSRKSLENVPVPTELDFITEISNRPGDLDYTNGSNHGEDDSKESIPSPASSELAHDSIVNHQESAQSEKSSALQNLEEKVTSGMLEKANIFGESNEFNFNSMESANFFGLSDPMTASFIGKSLPLSPEAEEFLVPGTPKSTTVEAPTSPTGDEITSTVLQSDFESPVDELVTDLHKSSDLSSPKDELQEVFNTTQEKTSLSGFEFESGANDIVSNVVSNEELILEPTKAINLEPTQAFNSSNPFSTSNDFSHNFGISSESLSEKPKTDFETDMNGPLSFVSPRFDADLSGVVPFEQLSSPTDIPNFTPIPEANSSFLASDLPKTPDVKNEFESVSPLEITTNYNTNVNDTTQDLFSDDTNPEIEETSFDSEKIQSKEFSHVQLESTEYKITQDEQTCEQMSKLEEDHRVLPDAEVGSNAVDKVLAAFDDIKLDEKEIETVQGLSETKEMELELESHIADSQPSADLNIKEEGFEIINNDELLPSIVPSPMNVELHNPQESLVSTEAQEVLIESQNKVNHDIFNAVDQLSTVPSLQDPPPKIVESEASKTVTYQTLVEVVEPQITKSEAFLTQLDNKSEDPVLDALQAALAKETEAIIEQETSKADESELPVAKAVASEPVQNPVVTETLITNIKENSEIPTSAGTPPPTPAPGLDNSQELHDTAKTDVLVAAVAAAGALAAGSAIGVAKEVKKAKEVTSKKPAVGAKKLSDTQTKAPAKLPLSKPSQSKPAKPTTTSTAKPTGTGPTAATNKSVAAKPSTTSGGLTKRPTTAATQKPAATKTASSTTVKQTTTSLKPVPKQLPLGKTTSPSTRPLSKPSTPGSKPTTPTVPKSPLVKSDATKPLARPAVKSPLANKTLLQKSATEKVAEKKPLANGEVKPLVKKTEVPKRPTSTSSTLKSVTKTNPPSRPAPNKTAVSKQVPTTNLSRPKPSTVGTNRPSTAPAGRTISGVRKQASNDKPLLNGKTAPGKPSGVMKKTDPKLSAKSDVKPPPIKRPEELKKEEEKPMQIQEANVTTTNGFVDHTEDQDGLKINDLAPQTVDIIN